MRDLQDSSPLSHCPYHLKRGEIVYLLAWIILIITGLVSVVHILFGLADLGEEMKLAVKISQFLFFSSLLFIVIRIPRP
ncbi:hypothetical protein IAE55_21425 [Paenibacillus sp. S28]|nr:hypothetical protein [Paenibacillus sp. S28]